MTTNHKIYYKNSQDLREIEDNSIDLIVTSPPYPMIEMWDELFFSLNSNIKKNFEKLNFYKAYKLMHNELNKTWKESVRVLKEGGIIAINIGDATRTLNRNFQLFTNHIEIINFMQSNKMQSLPSIIWRKTSNKPNKFMGSGMLPVNAYITLEHEYILIFRKGKKREFNKKEAACRRESAFFWEERNSWFSDVWFDLLGEFQYINKSYKTGRERNASFPLELPLRLINMFSIYEDKVLDPFLGAGTTLLASAILGRNFIGYEIDDTFGRLIDDRFLNVKELADRYINKRVESHNRFIKDYIDKKGKKTKYFNSNLNSYVITSQEANISFYRVSDCKKGANSYICSYEKFIRNLNNEEYNLKSDSLFNEKYFIN